MDIDGDGMINSHDLTVYLANCSRDDFFTRQSPSKTFYKGDEHRIVVNMSKMFP